LALQSGSRLGPYEIVAPLGAGGMGEVYRAHDPRLGRDVAIKALPDAFAHDADRLARFEREAKLLAGLSHPNIAGLLGLEEVEGRRYLVLECVEGETLAERLKRGPLPLDETLEVCRQIAAGVEAAHEAGVVHRDLKPGNVKLTPAGQVKVLDFGLARGVDPVGGDSGPSLSQSPTRTFAATGLGVVLGTAAYMSPEQARGRAVDRRADVWSFGCVLYECLAGRSLFEGETASDLIARILEREPDWSALPATTPVRVRDLLRRCLRKDAKERLRDIGDARLELAEALAAPADAAAPPERARPRRPGAWTVAAVAFTVAGLVLASFVALRAGRTPQDARTLRVAIQAPDGIDLSDEVPDIAIAPAGSAIVFAGLDTTGTRGLWLRPLDSNTARRLPGTDGAVIPFWSPDGRQLGFFAEGRLKRLSLQAGDVQVICAAPNPRGGAWGADDVLVFAPTASGPLMRVPASGGEPQLATTLDTARGESAHRFPSFLSDGRHFLYVALPGTNSQVDTRIGTLDSTEPGPVLLTASGIAVYAAPDHVVFLRQGAVVAQRFDAVARQLRGTPLPIRELVDATASYSGSPVVAVSRTGILVQRELRSTNTRVDILDRDGRRQQTLALPESQYLAPRFSPDGRHMVLSASRLGAGSVSLWMADLERGISTRFTFDSTFDTDGTWTRDGRRVIYGSDRTGGRKLYWRRADGSGPEELLADVPNLFNDPNDVSADDRRVVYRSLSGETGEDLWIAPLDGVGKPEPFIRTRFNELDAAISPDGRWIAYRSDESGRPEVYAQSFPALDQKSRVSTDGGAPLINSAATWIRWRRDGRELYFIGGDGRTIMAADLDPGATFISGPPRPLLRLPFGFTDADISPDGARIAVSMPTGAQGRSAINVVMNWTRELESAR
jgi:Tol biopolymer transport system component